MNVRHDAAAAGPAAGYVGPLGSCFVRKQPFEHVPLPGLPKRTACDIASGAMRLVRGDISHRTVPPARGYPRTVRRIMPQTRAKLPPRHGASRIVSPAASTKRLPVPIICRGGKLGAVMVLIEILS